MRNLLIVKVNPLLICILGPFLFIVLLNELQEIVNDELDLVTYVHDSSVIMKAKNIEEIEEKSGSDSLKTK